MKGNRGTGKRRRKDWRKHEQDLQAGSDTLCLLSRTNIEDSWKENK